MENSGHKRQADNQHASLWRVRGSLALEVNAVAYAVMLLVEGCDVPTALYRTYAKYEQHFIEEHRSHSPLKVANGE